MGNVFFGGGKVGMIEPVGGLPLSDLMEGQIVMINENGVAIPYHLAKHDYESWLNGAGKMLLARGEPYVTMALNSANSNIYADSNVDVLFNGDFFASLDSGVQNLISETIFPYTKGGTTTKTTLARKVFALSCAEFAFSNSSANVEGSALPIASTLNSGRSGYEGTRTPVNGSTNNYFALVNATGHSGTTGIYASVKWRPCFTIPSTTLVGMEPNADGSVNLKVSEVA